MNRFMKQSMENQKSEYVTPMARIAEIDSQSIICTSGGINPMVVDDDDAGDDFE